MAKLEVAETATTSLTGEIKDVRKRAQDAEAKAQAEEKARLALEEELAKVAGNKPVPEQIEEILEKKRREDLEKSFVDADEEFKRKFKEFSEENDAGGLKYERFKKEREKFNFNNVDSKEQYMERLGDVYKYINKTTVNDDSIINHSSPANGGHDAIVDDASGLTVKESNLIKQLGWTKEKYLETKAKRPAFVNQLLSR